MTIFLSSQPQILSGTAAGLASSAPEIHLAAPPAGTQPGFSREAAIKAALWDGATLREAVLVELTSPYSGSGPRLVWAVSQMPVGGIVRPSGGPLGASLHLPRPTYQVSFIDARTDELVFIVGG